MVSGIFDFAQTEHIAFALLGKAKHVRRNNIGENILLAASEIFRVEERRKVPPQSIPESLNHPDQRRRLFAPVVLDVEDGSATPYGIDGAGQDLGFHAFDVELEQAYSV